MVFIYETCEGDLFYTGQQLVKDSLFCCVCNKDDELLGKANSKENALRVLYTKHERDSRIINFANSIDFKKYR